MKSFLAVPGPGLRRVVALAGLALLPACAPVFSDFQSARTVGKGGAQLTPFVSSVSLTTESETEHIQLNVGARFDVGLSDRVDLQFGYVRIVSMLGLEDVEWPDLNVFGVGPKVRLGGDWAAVTALALPVGFAFGEGLGLDEKGAWQIHPTLIVTFPVSDRFDLNYSAKVLIPFDPDADRLLAFNAGAGFSAKHQRWVVRPEVGLLFNPGEKGVFWAAGVGFSYNLPGR